MSMQYNDIQGIVARSHSDLTAAAYLMLRFGDSMKARTWLKEMLPRVTPATDKISNPRLQIAFSYLGIMKMGLDGNSIQNFSPEFIQGMAIPYRARILGDIGSNDSSQWKWGGPMNPELHALIMVYADNLSTLDDVVAEIHVHARKYEVELVHRLDSASNPFEKEHFGFRDGISQPILPGLGKKGTANNPEIPAGEIVLGYPNAYHELPDSPLVPAEWDTNRFLDSSLGNPNLVDLGKNGTYLVFRQLKQNVSAFWKFLHETVKNENPTSTAADAVALAAKMVGRWPSGAPISCSPDSDNHLMKQENEFGYHEDDEHGFKCPVGSHIRRANPRDCLQGSNPEKALKISQRHRILRRGRNFGPPLVEDFDPAKLMQAQDDGVERGLHFICLNTNIARQFEFIQHTWSDNSKFEGLYNDPDPLLGIKDTRNKSETHDFTIPQFPLRRKVTGLQRNVDVIGGGYWFLPGIRALSFLAHFSPKSSV